MPDQNVLAFDFGTRRIGVAVGDLGFRLAHPLDVITATTDTARFGAIKPLIDAWKPVRLVVGLPVHMDGTEHELTRRARKFARQLEGRFATEVSLVDERLSSSDAEQQLTEAGVGRGKQRAVLDAVAAQQILQSFFDTFDDATA